VSVEKRVRNGKVSYVARWRGSTGKQESRSFDRKGEAVRYEAEQRRKIAENVYVSPNEGRQVIGEFAEEWFRHQSVEWKPKTAASARSLLDSQVLPYWKTVPLNKVNYDEVADWIAELQEKPGRGGNTLSPSRVRQAYHMLTGLLDGAVARRKIGANPARNVPIPRLEDRTQRRALTWEQVFDLADACHRHRDRLMILVLACTGLRWGEVAGLRVGHILVREGVPNLISPFFLCSVMDNVSDVNGKLVTVMPKSHERRSVSVELPVVVEAMRRQIAGKDEDELVFPGQRGGPLRVNNWRRDVFDKAAKEIGLPGLTPHELRHTAATLAIDSGASIKDVQVMLGHKDASLTLNRYGKHTQEAAHRVARAMSQSAQEAQARRAGRRHLRAVEAVV
jgi:integrase